MFEQLTSNHNTDINVRVVFDWFHSAAVKEYKLGR